MNHATPGCTLTGAHYRPLVLEAHGRIYFSGEYYTSATHAINAAKSAIEAKIYGSWHSHRVGYEIPT